ncbi:DUF5617 domain-containing protein [Legionella quateirensis]|uniref:RavJ-like C-terminal domain-containing protein n=1 Tax=Legionella quateirensis TaxID=45072 RepID=A0A378KXD1_9GAMM|nr:DUF5617 domain-containing protein [Legionella quateirensis]KTD52822.1 hypothetical protein Lqua_0655 [Legionella quateirensis]STY19242.1 Uncharacterised protein [Legionella quateirensis]
MFMFRAKEKKQTGIEYLNSFKVRNEEHKTIQPKINQADFDILVFRATAHYFQREFSPITHISTIMPFRDMYKKLDIASPTLDSIYEDLEEDIEDNKLLSNPIERIVAFQKSFIKEINALFQSSLSYTPYTKEVLSEKVLPRPASYIEIANCFHSEGPLRVARELLNDYTKGDSSIARFFSGHWNRHHTKEIADVVRAIDSGVIKDVPQLIQVLKLIPLENNQGSLAKRINFIERDILREALDAQNSAALKGFNPI